MHGLYLPPSVPTVRLSIDLIHLLALLLYRSFSLHGHLHLLLFKPCCCCGSSAQSALRSYCCRISELYVGGVCYGMQFY